MQDIVKHSGLLALGYTCPLFGIPHRGKIHITYICSMRVMCDVATLADRRFIYFGDIRLDLLLLHVFVGWAAFAHFVGRLSPRYCGDFRLDIYVDMRSDRLATSTYKVWRQSPN